MEAGAVDVTVDGGWVITDANKTENAQGHCRRVFALLYVTLSHPVTHALYSVRVLKTSGDEGNVAVASATAVAIGVGTRDPDGRVGRLRGPDVYCRLQLLVKFAFVAEVGLSETEVNHVEHFIEDDLVLGHFGAQPLEFISLVAAADADVEPPA